MEEIVVRLGAFALVGLASGFASGLFGIGGGIVRIPIFVYLLPLFGVAHPVLMHVAVGTSMALVLPSAVASTRKQLALGNLDLPFFKTWALGIFVGVLIGTALVPLASTEILQTIFAAFMVTVGVYEGFFKHRMVIAHARPRGALRLARAAAIGLRAALPGTAGGTLTTPALQAFSVRLEAAIATASATGLITGAVATIGAVVDGWHVRGLPVYSLMDERMLIAHVRNLGLIVFSACPHAGIVNVCLHARKLFPDVPIYCVMGGLHLGGVMERIIPDTVDGLRPFRIPHIITGHCTGWRALHALADAFGDAVSQSAVGTKYTFDAGHR